MVRHYIYRNDLRGNKSYIELGDGLSYLRFEFPGVDFIEGIRFQRDRQRNDWVGKVFSKVLTKK